MSVLEDLRGLETRVVNRIRELEGAVSELDELRAVAKRLGLDTAAPTSRPAPAKRKSRTVKASRSSRATRKRATSRSRSAGTARSSGRRDDVLAAIKAKPGVTVSQIGAQLGVDPTGLYRIVNKLTADGLVKRSDGKLTPLRAKA